jgi:hypothetical protein
MERKMLSNGATFGSWTILEAGKILPKSKFYCKCQCKCGQVKEVLEAHLRLGRTSRCYRCANKGHNLKHGASLSPEYSSWQNMKARCNNEKNNNYYFYGGRGIKVCERWNDFSNFYIDMGKKPCKDYHLDRIDPDGNYDPSNCRWTSPKENSSNRRCSLKNRDLYITIKKDYLCQECLNKVLKKEKNVPSN